MVIGSDEWRASDDAFALFLATVHVDDFSEFEARAYWKRIEEAKERDRVARLADLKAS